MLFTHARKDDDLEDTELSKLEVHKFLNNNKSTLLKLLPPTEDAFIQHLRQAATGNCTFAILTLSHLRTLDRLWMIESLYVFSAHSTQSVWRLYMIKNISSGTGCTKECKRNCVLVIKQIDCYIGYPCFVLTEQ